jgi:hypothetical protein
MLPCRHRAAAATSGLAQGFAASHLVDRPRSRVELGPRKLSGGGEFDPESMGVVGEKLGRVVPREPSGSGHGVQGVEDERQFHAVRCAEPATGRRRSPFELVHVRPALVGCGELPCRPPEREIGQHPDEGRAAALGRERAGICREEFVGVRRHASPPGGQR